MKTTGKTVNELNSSNSLTIENDARKIIFKEALNRLHVEKDALINPRHRAAHTSHSDYSSHGQSTL